MKIYNINKKNLQTNLDFFYFLSKIKITYCLRLSFKKEHNKTVLIFEKSNHQNLITP